MGKRVLTRGLFRKEINNYLKEKLKLLGAAGKLGGPLKGVNLSCFEVSKTQWQFYSYFKI